MRCYTVTVCGVFIKYYYHSIVFIKYYYHVIVFIKYYYHAIVVAVDHDGVASSQVNIFFPPVTHLQEHIYLQFHRNVHKKHVVFYRVIFFIYKFDRLCISL